MMPDFRFTSIADHLTFEKRLNNVPLLPGVYLWKDVNGQILYVGKSKYLRDRMRSYFGVPKGMSSKTRRLVGQIADFETLVTQSEREALLLEMNLIKQIRPKYNILLKDDKSYLYIKVTLLDEWPRIVSTRTVLDDGARYFGPYPSGDSVRSTLDFLNRLFAFRPFHECKDRMFQRHRRLAKPCLFYDLKRCLGPCVPGLVSQDDYRLAIESVCRFLDGKSDQIVRNLRLRMTQAADDLRFEQASALRDQIRSLERVLEKQQVCRSSRSDLDVVAVARDEERAVVSVLVVRGGTLLGTETFTLLGTEDETDSHLLNAFLTQFYDRALDIPACLVLAVSLEESELVVQWLSRKRGSRVAIQVPRRGEKRTLVEMAARNACQKLHEVRQQWLNDEHCLTALLVDLRDVLHIPHVPQRIECYDVSNTQGVHSVASMVVFEQGKPKKSAYRRFKIKTVQGANDGASLQEVIRRRFNRAIQQRHVASVALSANESWAILPDLIFIDGGLIQLNAVQDALREVGQSDIPVVGITKGKNRDRFDLVWQGQEEPLVLPRDGKILHFVQHVDEEAHRFAITYHRTVRDKATLTSPLDEIPGIGPRRKRALLKAFGSLDGIRQATIEQLVAVPGMNRNVAEELKGML
jgi:excinuclease ABC subunit C